MAVEKRPTAPASSSPLLDFSKDSLNSTGLLERSVAAQQATPTRHVVDDDQDCTETVKLEPLAFTIDFGDVTPGKKKETPKRFAERLASTTTGHGKRAPSSSSKAEVKKVIESQLRHWQLLLWAFGKLSSPGSLFTKTFVMRPAARFKGKKKRWCHPGPPGSKPDEKKRGGINNHFSKLSLSSLFECWPSSRSIWTVLYVRTGWQRANFYLVR